MEALTPGGRRGRAPRLVEGALALLVAVAFADSSIVVLALPDLYGQFDASVVGVSWVVTAYNAVFTAVALLLLAVVGRLRVGPLAAVGLAVFGAASVACALAPGLGSLIAARGVQGVGAALVLGASLPLLVGIGGSRERGVALWAAAGTAGVAAGPALGGVLTELFSWRAIFVAQVPVAVAALVALAHPRLRGRRPAAVAAPRLAVGAAAALALAFAALVGALFLAVLLVVIVLGYGPLAGALVVSALPLAALAVRPVTRGLAPATAVAGGAGLLAAGLAALAVPPTSSLLYLVPALAVAGAGLGLALPPLTRASLAVEGDTARDGVFSVAVRHLGLVIGLVAVAPLLAGGLEDATDRATLAGAEVVLDAPLPLRDKVPIALALYTEFERTPDGEVPDLSAPFENQGLDDREIRATRDRLVDRVEAVLTRGFRSSFALTAAFAVLAAAGALTVRRRARS